MPHPLPHRNPVLPSRRYATTLVLAGLTLCLVTACGGVGQHTPTPTAAPTATPTPVVPPPVTPTVPAPSATPIPPTPTPEPDPKLTRAIDKLLKGQRGVYGVVVMQPDGTIEYQRNADTPFVAASLYKLVLLANIYEKREQGELTFDQKVELLPDYFPAPDDFDDSYFDRTAVGETHSIDELVFATGAYSSNVAAKALLSLTNTSSLDQTTLELGLEDTYLFIDPTTVSGLNAATPTATTPDLAEAIAFVDDSAKDGLINITTPHDMSRYFQLLLAGQVIDPGVSTEILDILKQQAVDDRFPYLLPPDTDIAHKTGNLDHVVHDVGIIWTPSGPIILIAMIEDPPDDDHATQIIQRLALIAYGADNVPPFTAHAVEETIPTATPSDE
jgi:beta-lactamase class A